MEEHFLDCKGLRCPMPIVRLSQAIRGIPAGCRLRVEATDEAFPADIQAWAKAAGHRLIEIEEGAVKRALVEKQ